MSGGGLKRLADLLFPPKCVFCHEFLHGHPEMPICARCHSQIQAVWRCAHPHTLAFLDGTVPSALWYQGAVRSSVLRYKFHHRPGYSRVYAQLLRQSIPDETLQRIDIITWVPSGFCAWRRRGYNPAFRLAKELARICGKPAVPLLGKRPFVAQQAKTAHAQRKGNVLGAFRPRRQSKRHAMQTVLLIDDVLTTGSTLSECAKILKLSGLGLVFGATFARTPGKKH